MPALFLTLERAWRAPVCLRRPPPARSPGLRPSLRRPPGHHGPCWPQRGCPPYGSLIRHGHHANSLPSSMALTRRQRTAFASCWSQQQVHSRSKLQPAAGKVLPDAGTLHGGPLPRVWLPLDLCRGLQRLSATCGLRGGVQAWLHDGGCKRQGGMGVRCSRQMDCQQGTLPRGAVPGPTGTVHRQLHRTV
jgi:hypothetical protein